MELKVKNCMVDWLEFSVFEVNERMVKYALGLQDMTFEVKRGFYYNRVLSFENVVQISSGFKGNGAREHVHVKLTGKGCRLLEQMYGTTDLRSEIRNRLLFMDVKVSRMDIAVDFNLKFVIDYFDAVLNERVKGVKVVEHVGSLKSGLTLYLGSRRSEKFYRLYEKDFETGDFENYKDRLELVLKNDYATFELQNENELIKIVSTYMNDVEWLDESRQELWANIKYAQ
jgi:DNA relaxase NicK